MTHVVGTILQQSATLGRRLARLQDTEASCRFCFAVLCAEEDACGNLCTVACHRRLGIYAAPLIARRAFPSTSAAIPIEPFPGLRHLRKRPRKAVEDIENERETCMGCQCEAAELELHPAMWIRGAWQSHWSPWGNKPVCCGGAVQGPHRKPG